MLSFIENPGFQELVGTFLGWGLSYLLLWVVSRFVIVRKNTLSQAVALLEKAQGLSNDLAESKFVSLDESVPVLRQLKKKLLKADKMLSIYQYDHGEIMDLISLRANINTMIKYCEGIVLFLADEKIKPANSSVSKIQKICKDEISTISEISKIQSRKKMLEV